MHELSIADAIVQVAGRQAEGRRVVPSALEFSFDLVAIGTPVEGAELEVETVPAAGWCRSCGAESVLEGFVEPDKIGDIADIRLLSAIG